MNLENPHETITLAAAQRRADELQRVPEVLRPLLQSIPERARLLLITTLSDLVSDTLTPFERLRGMALGMIYMAGKRDELAPPEVSILVGYVLDLPARAPSNENFSLHLTKRLLNELENVVAEAARRIADPDADISELLAQVRTVRQQAASNKPI
ncbi:hypothetical protein [Pseudomonas ficuserectae]|uniref:Uncharacterized protein n=1 Tax=Pseudomonas ficuserectae TaxID=53410 RepID=A0ABV4PWF6_9PSED